MKTELNKIASIFISAFDMDIQRYLKKIIVELNKTKNGQLIAQWAKSNPGKFNVILHLISIAIQRIPNGNLLLSIVKSQLLRLPSEIIEIAKEKIESLEVNDYLDSDSNILSTGANLLKDWEKLKLEQNEPAMSLYDFLDNSPVAVKEFGQLLKDGINEHSSDKLKKEMLAEFDKPEIRFQVFENMRKLNPELTTDEILKLMQSSDFVDAQQLLIDTVIGLPDLYIKAATEMEKIHREIKTKIKGKDKNQSLEIFKSVYKNQISNYINELIKNKNLDDDERQGKIDRQLKYYGEIVELCESFK